MMPRTEQSSDDASFTLQGTLVIPEEQPEQESAIEPPLPTIHVGTAAKQPPQSCSSQKSISSPNNKRSIRFATNEAEVVGCVPMRSELSADEIRDSWWSTKEYQGIRLGAKFLTKDVRSRDRDLITGIEEAYARALHLACSLSDDDFDSLIADCSSQTACLKPWCARRLSARGLERYTSKKHRFERTEYAVETRAAVLRLAQNGDVTDDELSVFYREYARSAALYARFCGQADHAVVQQASRPAACCSGSGNCGVICSCCSQNMSNNDTTNSCLNKLEHKSKLECNSSNSTLPTVTSSGSLVSTASSSTSPKPGTAAPQIHCDGRRELLRRSKEPSRGRLLVRELSQRRIEAAV